jgi:hypothetical protein
MKFLENGSGESYPVTFGRTDGHDEANTVPSQATSPKC